MLRLANILAVCLLLPSVFHAQSTGNCQGIAVIANAVDAHGIPIKGLANNNFKASYHGYPANVLSTSYTEEPRRITVLLDVSGSMSAASRQDSNKWKIARVAILELLASALPKEQISFVTFADKVQEKLDFSRGREAIIRWLNDNPKPDLKGHTALFDTTFEALKQLDPTRPGDSIYVVTDGGDNRSKVSRAKLEETLVNSGVRLFTFLLDDSLTPEEAEGIDATAGLARNTGGFVFGVGARQRIFATSLESVGAFEFDEPVRQSIKAQAALLNAQVNNFYTLWITPAAKAHSKSQLSLKLLDGQGKPRKDVVLTFPRRLPPTPTSCGDS